MGLGGGRALRMPSFSAISMLPTPETLVLLVPQLWRPRMPSQWPIGRGLAPRGHSGTTPGWTRKLKRHFFALEPLCRSYLVNLRKQWLKKWRLETESSKVMKLDGLDLWDGGHLRENGPIVACCYALLA